VCGVAINILPDRDFYGDGGKNKKLLFLINKKG
jgi:hypothetical protein